ncbi:MAG TPA: C4-type zinc ribbon domain-containing protein [Chthonomonadaceae bacterium]|nr:C4-type zinc ribbon domain-containing protein [Chthonomonadaceae bacterium]
MKEKLAALYALQQLDSALDALKKQYAALDPGRAEEAAYRAAKAAHDEADANLHTTTTALRDAELEQKAVEAKRTEYETKLYSGSVRVPKELQAMQEEVEMLGRQRGKLDEKILTLMDDLEGVRAREAEARQRLTETETALRAKRATYKQEAERMQAQARELAAQRKQAAAAVAPDLIRRYESLRAMKGGVAIAPLEDNNACGGCKMGLPSQLVHRVRVGTTLEFCDNCGRILFDAHSKPGTGD